MSQEFKGYPPQDQSARLRRLALIENTFYLTKQERRLIRVALKAAANYAQYGWEIQAGGDRQKLKRRANDYRELKKKFKEPHV